LSYPDSVDTRLLALLDNVAWAKRNCSHCNRPLWLVRVNGGYNVAYTSEGRNHLEDCPQYTQQHLAAAALVDGIPGPSAKTAEYP
jgi:hypothetical protein